MRTCTLPEALFLVHSPLCISQTMHQGEFTLCQKQVDIPLILSRVTASQTNHQASLKHDWLPLHHRQRLIHHPQPHSPVPCMARARSIPFTTISQDQQLRLRCLCVQHQQSVPTYIQSFSRSVPSSRRDRPHFNNQ